MADYLRVKRQCKYCNAVVETGKNVPPPLRKCNKNKKKDGTFGNCVWTIIKKY